MISRALSRHAIFGLPAHCRSALFSHKSRTADQLPLIQAKKTLGERASPVTSLGLTYVTSALLKRHTTATSHSSTAHFASQDKIVFPIYKPPTSGFLSILPASLVPYAELARLDKPVGSTYLFLPCLFSTLLAAPLVDPIPPPTTILTTTLLFATGSLIMRGAGCTINDLWDRNLDPHVQRTALRPLARRALTPFAATSFLGLQLLGGLSILLQFPNTYQCCLYAIPSLIPVFLYPLAKRVTNYPQVVLGFTFGWGAIMGFPVLGIDFLENSQALITGALLYASSIAWTTVYDMIYAQMDIKYDVKAGIKSIALAHSSNTKTVLSGLAVTQVGLLAAAGVAAGSGPLFFTVGCGGAAISLGTMIWRVKLDSVENCLWWFVKGAYFVGGAIGAGLGGDYVVRYLETEKERTGEDKLAE